MMEYPMFLFVQVLMKDNILDSQGLLETFPEQFIFDPANYASFAYENARLRGQKYYHRLNFHSPKIPYPHCVFSLKIYKMIKKTLLFTSLIYFTSCQSIPKEETLKEIAVLSSGISDKEYCRKSLPDNKHQKQLELLLSQTGYDCYTLQMNGRNGKEDSVLILKKHGALSQKILFYDFASRTRELKTWDYPNAGDKREKVANRTYLQTVGFD
ncbi:MAG: hypothetical protein WBP58_10775 [Chitinophagaceae bacterium]